MSSGKCAGRIEQREATLRPLPGVEFDSFATVANAGIVASSVL